MATVSGTAPRWTVASPIIAFIAVIGGWGRDLPSWVLGIGGLILIAAVLSAVYHAEVVAARVGEPFGSLVLAVAVTVIEVALIVTLMLTSTDSSPTLARDTVFAALMITCNGIVGLALVVRTFRGGVAYFNSEGSGSALAAIATLATLSLVLPSFTQSSAQGTFNDNQLAYAAVSALVIYLLFLFVQTIRHRDYFLPPDHAPIPNVNPDDEHAEPPSVRAAWISVGLLMISLVGVVGLAKITSPLIYSAVSSAGLPLGVVAVSIALLVLLPESISAVRAAARKRTQTSLNLAYGSAMASIGLTIPTIAVVAWVTDFELTLGLGPTDIVLLAITMFISALTIIPGRATLLQGGMHVMLFVGFIMLVLNP